LDSYSSCGCFVLMDSCERTPSVRSGVQCLIGHSSWRGQRARCSTAMLHACVRGLKDAYQFDGHFFACLNVGACTRMPPVSVGALAAGTPRARRVFAVVRTLRNRTAWQCVSGAAPALVAIRRRCESRCPAKARWHGPLDEACGLSGTAAILWAAEAVFACKQRCRSAPR
jgi:hypothetical protein